MKVTRDYITLKEQDEMINRVLDAVFPEVIQIDIDGTVIGSEVEYRPQYIKPYTYVYGIICFTDYEATEGFNIDDIVEGLYSRSENENSQWIGLIINIPQFREIARIIDDLVKYRAEQLNNPMSELTKAFKKISKVVDIVSQNVSEENINDIMPALKNLGQIKDIDVNSLAKAVAENYKFSK